MQKLSIRKLSLLGLVLMAASAVTAAVLPKDDSKKTFNGKQQDSTGGGGNQVSCINQSATSYSCTYTAGTATTTNPDVPGNQPNGTSANRNSSQVGQNFFHSSQSPE